MVDVVRVVAAFGKASRDLVRGDILWQALWPPLLFVHLCLGRLADPRREEGIWMDPT